MMDDDVVCVYVIKKKRGYTWTEGDRESVIQKEKMFNLMVH